MASIKFHLQSKSKLSPIYLRLSLNRDILIRRKTGLFVNPKDWSSATGYPIQNNSVNKDLKTDLKELDAKISKNLNDANSNGVTIDGKWLIHHIDLHFDRIKEEKIDNSLLGHIQKTIDQSATKRLKSGKIGLSKNRVKGLVTFKGLIETYQNFLNSEIELTSIDASFEEEFRNWLLITKGYSTNYAGKNFDNLKAICRDAKKMGKEVHPHLENLFGFSEEKDERNIITLSFDELDQIRGLRDLSDSMENVRKWLLLGCEIGQRGGDLLNITESNISIRDGIGFIDVRQQKTRKEVPIAIRPSVKNIIDLGMPYKISIQRFNSYLKDLCELAGMVTPTEGKVYDKVKKRKIAKLYPKYQLISSHTCRKSFATNYYKLIPTPLLMATTGHSKESLFLAYIGENEDKDADAKLMYKFALVVEEERRQELEKRKLNQKATMKKVHKKAE